MIEPEKRGLNRLFALSPKTARLLVRFGGSLIMLCLALQFAHGKTLLKEIGNAHWGLVFIAGLLLLTQILPMTVRWQVLLRRMDVAVGFVPLMRISLLSSFWGAALPSANGNDLVRGLMLGRRSVPTGTVIGSIFVDRTYGLISLAMVGVPGTIFLYSQNLLSGHMAALIGTATAMPALIVALIFWRGDTGLTAPLLRLPLVRQTRARIQPVIRQIRATFMSRRDVLTCILLSLMAQGIAIAGAAILGRALGLNLALQTYAAVLPAVWLITALPVSLSGIGVREAGYALLLSQVGLRYEQGLALGALTSLVGLLGALTCGLAILAPAHAETA